MFFSGFKSAVEAQDTEEARQYIDFPSVKRSLKDQLEESLTKKLSSEISDGPLSLFGIVLIRPMVRTIVNSTVDATVNPAGLNLLLSTGNLSSKDSKTQQSIRKYSNNDQSVNIKLYYQSLNRFVMRTDIPDVEEPMKAYWKRDLLWSWKLSSIDLPFELIRNLANSIE